MTRSKIKTTIQEAKNYWQQIVDECDLSVDWSEADTHCWRCGCKKDLERCHIIPDSLEGKDEPSNIVLLCKRCHADGPNVRDSEIMWDWIKAYRTPFYETFWSIQGMKEYEFIYKEKVEDELEYILTKAGINNSKEINQIIKEELNSLQKDVSIHFGQPYLNTATMAGLYRMMLKRISGKYGVTFPKEN